MLPARLQRMALELVSPLETKAAGTCRSGQRNSVARDGLLPSITSGNELRAPKLLGLPFGLSMLAPVLMNYGSEEQQQRFLPDIRDRKVNWCQGYSEPNAGSICQSQDQG